MSVSGLKPAFCTVAYADNVCDSVAWNALNDSQKESALQYARVYIEDTYYCNFDLSATGVAPDNVQTGSALLAQIHASSDIFAAQDAGKPAQGLTATSVDAKGVKSGKNWDAQIAKQWKDPFPQITAILQIDGWCSLNKGSMRVVSRL